jgi:hypothetical protein
MRRTPSTPAYAQWLAIVSSPMTLVTNPVMHERTDIHLEPHTTLTDDTWDGLSLDQTRAITIA